uniref:N-lysine methyltransferase SMYD2-B-like n=1 Tax=Dermatophagoides pteronyssinus TaxID=6956 RepID=A0A6P6Y5H5_DERPT|nr:N-lysine methyltransferase SMYD2-B-like [Dermatophagoides pteronyssinus]
MNSHRQIAESDHNYQPGDVIFRLNEPFVYVTKYEHRLFTCDQCMQSIDSSIVCPGCRKVYYCSTDCQMKAWYRLHRIECPILAKREPMQFENEGIDYMQRLTLRLYLLMTSKDENNPSGQKRSFTLPHNGQKRMIDDMETHSEQLKDSEQFGGIINYFKFYKIDDYDHELLLKCYGLLHVNSFGIDCYDTDNLTIDHRGCGLYLEASVFDHSCVPNACAAGDSLTLEIRALRPIRPGDLIYLDYIQDILPKDERIKHLEERYFFTCQCIGGCDNTIDSNDAFDSKVDFKRYKILENLIERLNSNNNNNNDDNGNDNNDDNDHDEDTWRQLYQLWTQRLVIQEEYYRKCVYHPCLSLFYQTFLRFFILNHQRFWMDGVETEMNRVMTKTREHLAITHGNHHQFYRWTVGNFDA